MELPLPARNVSIHAPVQGATPLVPDFALSVGRFNPRPRAGGDPKLKSIASQIRVSIHAPVQGATVFTF